jgi:hypothetical protein
MFGRPMLVGDSTRDGKESCGTNIARHGILWEQPPS